MLFQFKILVPEQSPANLYAYFYATPVSAPQPSAYALTREAILTFLADKGIVYGIQESAIEKVIQQSFAHHELIAVGLPPLMGADASFLFLAAAKQRDYEAIFTRYPQPQDKAWLERLMALTVTPQTPLVQKIPPSRGAPGIDVFGTLIPGLKGQEKVFPPYRNALIDPEDKLRLLSAIEGIPAVDLPRYIDVLPLTVLQRDMKESAYFKGTVAICGHVADYVRIRAYGDILVLGTVDAAVLLAGRHIWIRQGVKGKDTAVLKSKTGNILMRFAERATLEAGQNILAEATHHCYAVALDSVAVNYVLGGEVMASRHLWIDIAGSPGVDSVLACGNNPYLISEIDNLGAQLTELEEHIAFLKTELSSKIVTLARTNPILLQHYRHLLPKKEYLRHTLQLRLKALKTIDTEARTAAIDIASGLYPDTLLKINQFEKLNHDFVFEPATLIAGKYGVVVSQKNQEMKQS